MRIFRRHDRDTNLDPRMTGDGLAEHFGLNRSVNAVLLQDQERADHTENETP